MDGKRQVGSSSSFTAELFGTKESSSPSSTGIFASFFPPPATVLGRNSSSSKASESWQKLPLEHQAWNMKHGTQAPQIEAAGFEIPNNYKEGNSVFQEERTEPCHLSSSLYYGGQDIYSHSPRGQTPEASYPIFKKDTVAGDHDGNNPQDDASRGNWWQGSLYY